MKVAQICPYDFSRHGGVKTHILQLSEALRMKGHEVHIIAPNGAQKIAFDDFHSFGKNFSMPFLGTKIDINAALGIEKKKLKTFLKESEFDIIHLHTVWNPILAFQILFLSKAKNIATFHDTPKNNWIGKFFGRFIMPMAARIVFTKLDGIISVSDSQSMFIKRFSKRKIHIIPNGISLPESAIQDNIERDPNQLLFLGRLEPRKGLLSALKVYQSLEMHNSNFKLIIAGEGDQFEEGQNFVKNQNLKNVTFLGKVSDEQKWELFKSSYIYLATAEYGESFGIVLLEAMSQGTLLAGFANEGYKNILSHKQLKYFSTPGNTTDLEHKVMDLVNLERVHAQTLVEEGKEVTKKYNWKILVEKVCEVYDK